MVLELAACLRETTVTVTVSVTMLSNVEDLPSKLWNGRNQKGKRGMDVNGTLVGHMRTKRGITVDMNMKETLKIGLEMTITKLVGKGTVNEIVSHGLVKKGGRERGPIMMVMDITMNIEAAVSDTAVVGVVLAHGQNLLQTIIIVRAPHPRTL
jgi:hypothetical protein